MINLAEVKSQEKKAEVLDWIGNLLNKIASVFTKSKINSFFIDKKENDHTKLTYRLFVDMLSKTRLCKSF